MPKFQVNISENGGDGYLYTRDSFFVEAKDDAEARKIGLEMFAKKKGFPRRGNWEEIYEANAIKIKEAKNG